MSERITVRLDEAVYGRLSDAARARGTDVSSVVRQAVMAYLEGARGTAPASPPSHTPEDCLAVVVSYASPVAQRRLAEAFARLDRIRTRLWLVAETLALWAAQVEPRAHTADE
jgi:hypothetical protein